MSSDNSKISPLARSFRDAACNSFNLREFAKAAMEFIMTQTRASNMVFFTPATCGDWGVTAHANLDNEEAAWTMQTDFLANHVDRFFLTMPSGTVRLASEIDELKNMIGDRTVASFVGEAEGEHVGCLVLFRNPQQPFAPEVIKNVEEIMREIAKHLADIVHVHYRMKPRDQWGDVGDVDNNNDDSPDP